MEGLLEHAEAEVRNAIENRQLEGGKPGCFKPMRACIAMVYGNATALCAAFGLPNSTNYAKKLDVITTRVLNLYKPESVEAIAEAAGCASAPSLQMHLKRMQVSFDNALVTYFDASLSISQIGRSVSDVHCAHEPALSSTAWRQ